MLGYRIRLRNRLLQFFYKPGAKKKPRFISAAAVDFMDELEKTLEEKFSSMFEDFD